MNHQTKPPPCTCFSDFFSDISRFLTFFSDLLFWFLYGHFEISNLFFRLPFLISFGLFEISNLFFRLVVSTKFRSFLISLGSPDFKPLFWNSFLNQNIFSYFFFSFSSLDPFDLNNLSFSNFGLRYSNPPH